jgi:hypothetical protein
MPAPRTAKKSSTPTKVAVKAKGQKYEYTELAKVSLTATESTNVYGVIIDATFPYKVTADKYITSLKIVDPSLHSKGGKPTDNDWAQVVIYADKFEDLPIISKVGDIIRLHRANVRIHNGHRQFNVSIQQFSSWAVFPAEDNSVAPASYSGKRASFEKHESALLAALRKWVGSHFGSHDGVTSDLYTPLSKAKSAGKDFDVVAKILSIHDLDEYTHELKLADSTGDNWYTLALKLKFPNVQAGQVVRIRSATYDETSTHKQVLALSHYSNILSFASSSKLARTLGSKVNDDWKQDQAELAKDVPSHAIILSEVDKKHAGLKQTSLNDLFHQEGSLTGNTFRTTFSVLKVEGPTAELVQSYNKTTKKASSAKGTKGGDLIWRVSLLVKDASTAANSNKYRINVNSHEGLGAEFFGKAANLHSEAAALKRVQHQVDNLTKFNTFVDAVVEKRGGQYLIKDTKLRA